ncbi:MAG TPA: hypothetical protein VMT76_08355 [Puia sp.]|nr:hypothetical protein [Puia sp.]
MKKYVMFAALFFASTVFAAEKGTWTGYISDSHCGVKGAGHEECAKKCVKNGAAPVFVIGDKVYKITDPKKVSRFIGDKVTISGTITDDSIDIDTVKK